MSKEVWVEKYRPKTISSFLFQSDSHKNVIEEYIRNQNLSTHLLLSGSPGTGKTSLALLLKNELGVLDSDFKMMNASDNTSVDDIRHSVKSFCQTMPVGDMKLMLLDEADYLSHNAQAALRGLMEQYIDSVKFILTCNSPHKVIPAIKSSRCPEIIFKQLDRKDILKHIAKILKNEDVKFNKDDNPKELLEEFIDSTYPDMRALINKLQQSTINGILHHPMESTKTVESLISIVSLLENDDWLGAREKVCDSLTGDEWEEAYRFLYDHLHELGKFKEIDNWRAGIVILADHLYRHALVADPEINFSACMIRLSEI